MKKKTPKNSDKHKRKERQEKIVVFAIFVIFIAIVAYLFYFLNFQPSSKDAVAIVNGDKITRDELDWWYKISILPEDRDLVTRQDFLVVSLIPQEVLVQKAEEDNIKVTKNDIEELIGLFIIQNGLTLNEFESHLESRGLTIDDIRTSFETRATIIKLLEKENIDFLDNNAFKNYLNNLTNSSDIKIFPENINKLVLKSFEETSDKICNEDKPIVRLYTTTTCEICEETGEILKKLVEDSAANGKIEAYHWSLDTGDDLLTAKKENGIPKAEVDIFKKYSSRSQVPAVIIGCKYKHIGKLSIEEEDELKAILKTLINKNVV